MRNAKKKKKKKLARARAKPKELEKRPSSSEFRLEIQEKVTKKVRRKRKGKMRYVHKTSYKTIPQDEFRRDRSYRIYLVHKPTKQKRILGFGKFNNIPFISQHPDTKGRLLGGRWFRPNTTDKPVRKRGKWIPTASIIRDIEKELEEYGESFRHEIRGAIIPPKNYYHVDWKIFSDVPLSGDTVWTKFGINCVIEYVYTNQQWIGKRTIMVDTLGRGIKIKNLHLYEDRWKFELETKLDEMKQNRRGELNIIEINGFVPATYIPGEKEE